jgi:hypothetical protein
LKGFETNLIFMGLNGIGYDSYTHWENGANVSYNGWNAGEPAEWNVGERCTIIWFENTTLPFEIKL